jgi:hypothetical protein
MREEICKARQMNETTVEIFKTQKKNLFKEMVRLWGTTNKIVTG